MIYFSFFLLEGHKSCSVGTKKKKKKKKVGRDSGIAGYLLCTGTHCVHTSMNLKKMKFIS